MSFNYGFTKAPTPLIPAPSLIHRSDFLRPGAGRGSPGGGGAEAPPPPGIFSPSRSK